MSESATANPANQINNKPTALSAALDRLDARLSFISDRIWPETPYLLTVPSERSFHLSEQQAADLQRHTLFDSNEQQLQYMSFLATGWDNTLIVPVGAWEEDKIDGSSISSRSQKMQSAGNTPKVAGKKISMSEYKKRAATTKADVNGTSASSADSKKQERIPSSSSSARASASSQLQGSLKRPSDAIEDRPRLKDGLHANEEHPPKRAKNSPRQSALDERPMGSKSSLALPPPLSPTLPAFVERLLARGDEPPKTKTKDANHSTDDGITQRSASASKKPPPKDFSALDLPAREEPEGIRKAKSHPDMRSQAQVPRKAGTSSTKQLPTADGGSKALVNGASQARADRDGKAHRTTVSVSSSDAGRLRAASNLDDDHAGPGSTQSKVVRLKIPRRIRVDVQRILKLQPRLKSRPSDARVAKSAERGEAKAYEQDGQGSLPKASRDRAKSTSEREPRREADSERFAEKRPRQEDESELASQSSRFKSPALANRPSSKKPRESTPTTAREEAATPQGSIMSGTPAAPGSVEKSARDARHTPSDSGSSQSATSEMIDALKREQSKYFELGRALKKESDRIYKPGQDPAPSPTQMKKWLAMRIEVTLSFMLAYIIGDETNRLRRTQTRYEGTWGTLFPWLQSLVQQITEDPHLSGLALQLEAVCMMVAWSSESEHVVHAGYDKPESVKRLKRQYDDAQRKFVEGSTRLSVDDLQQDFPRTWRAKARAPLAHTGFKLTTKESLNGEFYLPITSITLPLEAVRAGKSLLAEWCRREGVDWTARLNF